MSANLVKFVTGNAASFAALTTKDENTLYFITDERRVYKGSTPMSGGIYKSVTSYPAAGEVNTIYVNTTDGSVQFWNGTAWQVLVKPTVSTISGAGDNLHLASTKAIVDYVAAEVQKVNSNATALTNRVKTLEDEMDAAEGRLDTLEGAGEGSVKKAVADALASAKAYTDTLANGAVKTNTTDIAKLKTDKANKATTLAGYGIADAYTKTQTDSAIATAVANAGHLTREIVTTLPNAANARENVIYMVPKAGGGTGYQKYNEYMLINGALEKIGDTEVDLTDYAKTADVISKVAAAKSEAISAAAADAKTKADAAQAAAEKTADNALKAYKTTNDAAVQANTTAISTINGTGAGSIKKATADALADAKKYADGLAGNYATKEQGAKADSALQVADITTGTANGTIGVKGSNVPVKGLGSAAFAATTAFDASGAAAGALASAKAYTNQQVAAAALTWGTL